MDVIAAYRDVGSYRGAAEICGTTHKIGEALLRSAVPNREAQSRVKWQAERKVADVELRHQRRAHPSSDNRR